jgi:hypothetical protein
MAYVSIVNKLNDRIDKLHVEITYQIDDYNMNRADYPHCQYYQIAMLEKKIKKVQKMTLEIVRHDRYDEAGYSLDPIFEVFINNKRHKRDFYIGETLPNGEKLGYFTTKQVGSPCFV